MSATLRPPTAKVNAVFVRLTNWRYRKRIRNSRLNASNSLRMDEQVVLDRLAALEIETPSWGYGNSGTRFHVYPWPGAARSVWERIDDAALVHRLTGCCPSVALHIPWDRVDDWAALRSHAEEQGIRIGAINPNLFGEDDYRLGSLCHPDVRVREHALAHCRGCVDIARELGSAIISLWLADGTNYPGQDDLRGRYADDDLIAGSIDPFELFRIMREIAAAGATRHVAFMIDQSHNVEGKIDAMIQSVMNIQTAYAKALLVDEPALAEAQLAGDVLGAHRILLEAFETDVRPLLGHLRGRLGVAEDPVAAFREGGFAATRVRERGTASVESAYERL